MLPFFAHSRHIVFSPVLVYGFGAIFGKITAIEPLKISRSISDRVDCPPIRLSCFGIISVSVRQFSPVSFSVTAKWLKKPAGYAKKDKISV